METEVAQGKPKSCFAVTGASRASLLTVVTTEVRRTSMGGLLTADALIQFVQDRPDANAPLWPRIIACLAFDTPVCSEIIPRVTTI